MIDFWTDWETFLHDFGDDLIFRVHKHKKIFTPYEQDRKFCDENLTENMGDFKIACSVELPNKELLVGMRKVCVDEELVDGEYVETLSLGENVEYFMLKDISLTDVTMSDEYSFLRHKYKEEYEKILQD